MPPLPRHNGQVENTMHRKLSYNALAYLDLIDITDSMIEFDRTSLLHIRLRLCCSPIQSLNSSWGWSERVPRNRRVRSCRARLCWRLPSLLHRTMGIERDTLPRSVGNGTVATLSGRAELNLWAFDTVLYRALPARRALFRKALVRGRRRRWTRLDLHRPAGAD